MTNRRGLCQMIVGISSALFFAVPAVVNMMTVVGYLEAEPAVRSVSAFGMLGSLVAVVVAVLFAADGWRMWRY